MRCPFVCAAAAVAIAASLAAAQAGNPFESPRPAANPFEAPATPVPSTPAPPAPAVAPRTVLRVAQMSDPGMGNMPSHTILVPDGWRLEGSAWWPPKTEMYGIPPSQFVKLSAPDGRMVTILPNMLAVDPRPTMQQRPADGTYVNGVPVAAYPASPEAWRAACEQHIFRVMVPDAEDLRLDPVTDVPALNVLLQRQLEPTRKVYAENNRQMAQFGMSSAIDGNVFATTAHYTLGGKRYEHLLLFAAYWQTTRSQLGADIRWAVDPCVTFRAEEGRLAGEMPLLMAVANSLRMTDGWARMRADHLAKMWGIAQRGVAERSAIWADASREISRTITEGYNDRTARMDRAADNYSKGFRGVDDYVPASGSSVPAAQLPHDYAHVYGNARGEYVLTNDANYDPNRDPALNAQTWEPMRPQR